MLGVGGNEYFVFRLVEAVLEITIQSYRYATDSYRLLAAIAALYVTMSVGR